MSDNLSNWRPRALPQRQIFEGRYVRLEPLDAVRHGDALYEACAQEGVAERFRWLYETPPGDRASFQPWLEKSAASEDPMYFAVFDRSTGQIAGRQAFMRIEPAHGVIEIGSILWTDKVARRPAATEALYLFARHAFDDLGYRRFEWKCNADNAPSRTAALRFGFTFEGVFRKHLIVKGKRRDTAWFAMLEDDWPAERSAYEAWLDPANFDAEGRQRRRLADFR